MHPGTSLGTNKPDVVRRPFITESNCFWKERMMFEQREVRKNLFQQSGGFVCLQRTVQVRYQIGRRDVDAAVAGITAGRKHGRIRSPHPRSREGGREQ